MKKLEVMWNARHSRKRFFSIPLLLMGLLILPHPTQSGVQDMYAGKSLEDGLRRLQMKGLPILYSSSLVRPDMLVTFEPKATSHSAVLKELLIPFGLTTHKGPSRTLLVIREPADRKASRIIRVPSVGLGQEYVIVPFVTIYLTAQDTHDQFVTNLKTEDLVLKENGVERPITELTNYTTLNTEASNEPSSIFFLIDSSESMGINNEGSNEYIRTKQIAMRLLDEFRPGDQMMVVGFNESFWVLSEMTQDTEQIAMRLQEDGVTKGRTALYDALMAIVEKAEDIPGRKIVILCSDGEDNYSRTTLNELLQALQYSNLMVLSFGSNIESKLKPRNRKVLEKITRATGGHSFFLDGLSDSVLIVDEIKEAMTSQYGLGFFPANPSRHGLRDLEIKCKVNGVRLQYRKSYLF